MLQTIRSGQGEPRAGKQAVRDQDNKWTSQGSGPDPWLRCQRLPLRRIIIGLLSVN